MCLSHYSWCVFVLQLWWCSPLHWSWLLPEGCSGYHWSWWLCCWVYDGSHNERQQPKTDREHDCVHQDMMAAGFLALRWKSLWQGHASSSTTHRWRRRALLWAVPSLTYVFTRRLYIILIYMQKKYHKCLNTYMYILTQELCIHRYAEVRCFQLLLILKDTHTSTSYHNKLLLLLHVLVAFKMLLCSAHFQDQHFKLIWYAAIITNHACIKTWMMTFVSMYMYMHSTFDNVTKHMTCIIILVPSWHLQFSCTHHQYMYI